MSNNRTFTFIFSFINVIKISNYIFNAQLLKYFKVYLWLNIAICNFINNNLSKKFSICMLMWTLKPLWFGSCTLKGHISYSHPCMATPTFTTKFYFSTRLFPDTLCKLKDQTSEIHWKSIYLFGHCHNFFN